MYLAVCTRNDGGTLMISMDVRGLLKEGDRFLNKRDPEKALEYYEEAINIDNQCAEAWYKKGNVLSKIKEYEKALEVYEKAVDMRPTYAEAWYKKGNILSNLKRYEEALEVYTEIIGIFERLEYSEKTDEIKLKYAEICHEKGNTIGNLKDKHKKNEDALKSYEKAVELCNEIIGTEKTSGEASNKEIIARFRCDNEKLVKMYRELVELEKGNAAWCRRGDILFGLGRYEDAVKAYEKATEKHEKDIKACNGRGSALYHLGRYEEALEACEKATGIYEGLKTDERTDGTRQQCADAWHTKGGALDELGRYEEALEAYEKALELNPEDSHFWNNKGVALYNLERDEEALEAYKKALELDPKNAVIWNGKGAALYRLKRYKEALTTYEKAIELNRKYATPYANLGELFLIHGSLEKAFDNVEKAYSLNKTHFLALLIKGRVEIEKKEYDCAVKFFEKAAHSKLGNPLPLLWTAYARYLKAESHFKPKSKEHKEIMFAIIRDLEKAYDLSKEYQKELKAFVLYVLGYFYYKNGDIFTAKERLEDCIGLESKVEKLKRVFGSESFVRPRTRDLLNYIWDYEIKPSWWRWWLFSPTWHWPKRVLFFLFLLPIPFLLLFHPVIPTFSESIVTDWRISGVIVVLLILILLSPNIEKIKVKDIEMEMRSPPVFETFLPPLDIEKKYISHNV